MTRFSKAAALALVLAATLGLAACAEEDAKIVRVASKNFTENMLMAEMMARIAEEDGLAVQRAIPYGSSAETFEALKQGRIDLYPEYNGTGLVYLGQPPMTDGDAALARVRELYGALELDWRERLGFSSDYVLVVRPEVAQAQGITRISDLAQLASVDFATDDTFVERPLDGLNPLVRRYGLRPGKVLTYSLDEGGKDAIAQAVLEGDALVGELFRTDQQIDSFDLVVLQDDLAFFPVYEPSPLVRREALTRFPELGPALAKLENKLTADAMREMIAEVELEGRSVAAVAFDYLVASGLLQAASEAGDTGGGGADPLVVAMGELDSLAGPAGKAVRAARSVFPKRSVVVERAPNPLDLVTSGAARLAVAGVDSFYDVEGDNAVLTSPAEALGVVGFQVAHVITRENGPAGLAEVGKLGVGQAGSSSDRVARMALAGIGLAEVNVVAGQDAELGIQFEAMAKGLVDALFVMAPLGDTAVLELLEGGSFKLLPIPGWTEGNAPLRFSFLRQIQIPQGTYDGQQAAIETLGVQMVLAGPSGGREAFGAQGPGTTGTAATQPLPASTVQELSKALGSAEAVDPAAPAAAALRPTLDEGPQPLVADPATSLINLVASLFLVWMVYLLVARPRRAPDQPSDIRITPARSADSTGE
ncbi:glycine betaine ABC transporter substrate-binding protein [Pelagibius sp.]|uniref:glycine betaine ABC transporter substrate-binding protein n=1 Tax=Pelagibius sp. TaxID=1931238 RepID=UPI00260D7185|nr:glycine betaine ABC transporter substrate-binding protein [Pelagibius sp.]